MMIGRLQESSRVRSRMQFATSILLAIICCASYAHAQQAAPIDARVKQLQESVKAIRSIYRAEVEKIDEAKIEAWYFQLTGWPTSRSEWLSLYFPMDDLPIAGSVHQLQFSANGSRQMYRSSAPIRFEPDVEFGGAMLLDDASKIAVPVERLSPIDEFTLEIDVKFAKHSSRTILMRYSDEDASSSPSGLEWTIENGHPCLAMVHQWPSSALRIRCRDSIPENQWVRLAISYAGTGIAEDFSMAMNGNRSPFVIESENLHGEIVSKKRPGTLRFGERVDSKADLVLIRNFKMYRTALTHIEIAESSLKSQFLTWEELAGSQKTDWREHYARRVDSQCKYHLESLRHYVQALNLLQKDPK